MPTPEGARALPVYLIHWNAPDWCASAVRSVMASERVDVDLTVIDNGQLDGPPLRECVPPGTRILTAPHNTGYAGGANLALRDWRERHADGQWCVIGSHDLHVSPDALARLVAAAEDHPGAGIVAPATTRPQATTGGAWTGTRSFQFGPLDGGGIIERDWARGACLLLRRECVGDVGPFDERFGSYMEDVDYALRARDHGWKVVVDTDAHIEGLGATSDTWIAAITTNTILLGGKRGGVVGAVRAIALYSFWLVRAAVSSVVPWHARERRAESRRYCAQRWRGLVAACRGGRLSSMVRHPAVSG